jgi:hypothetical protein
VKTNIAVPVDPMEEASRLNAGSPVGTEAVQFRDLSPLVPTLGVSHVGATGETPEPGAICTASAAAKAFAASASNDARSTAADGVADDEADEAPGEAGVVEAGDPDAAGAIVGSGPTGLQAETRSASANPATTRP